MSRFRGSGVGPDATTASQVTAPVKVKQEDNPAIATTRAVNPWFLSRSERRHSIRCDTQRKNAARRIEMFNLSSYFSHSMEIDVEGVKAATKHARVFGEMNKLYAQRMPTTGGSVNERNAGTLRRATIFEMYRATATNFLRRGADGLSIFHLGDLAGAIHQGHPARRDAGRLHGPEHRCDAQRPRAGAWRGWGHRTLRACPSQPRLPEPRSPQVLHRAA